MTISGSPSTMSIKSPFSSATVPIDVPLIMTAAPRAGSPVSASITLPLMDFSCGVIPMVSQRVTITAGISSAILIIPMGDLFGFFIILNLFRVNE